jgi:uncharacterized protein YjbI with pentapeptide repeats
MSSSDVVSWGAMGALLAGIAWLLSGLIWFAVQQESRQQEIENQRSQDITLQAYLDNISNLLISEQGTQLRKLDPDDEVLDLVQARTEMLFQVIDSGREESVILFFVRAGLNTAEDPIISLADINLSGIDLAGIDLSSTNFAQANLARANLASAVLQDANLARANLNFVTLSRANLQSATLQGATLIDADLSGANLQSADLQGADFTNANLASAREVTDEQLDAARSLQGATMPNGQKYEDWLKSKGSGKD